MCRSDGVWLAKTLKIHLFRWRIVGAGLESCKMPVTFSSYRVGPGQRVSYKTVPPPWDWLLRRENELEPRRSRSQIIFAVLVPPLYVAVQAPALIVTGQITDHLVMSKKKIAEPRYKRGMTFSQTKKPTSAVSYFEYPFKFYEKTTKKDP